MVGMFPGMEYEEAAVELCPGDVLLAFTDGVPEAHNPENEEFGEERLQQLLAVAPDFRIERAALRVEPPDHQPLALGEIQRLTDGDAGKVVRH